MHRSVNAILSFLLFTCSVTSAQTPRGYTAASAARERAIESILLSIPDTAQARAEVRALSALPHVAGTPAQQATAEYVLRQMKGFGLDTARVNFRVYLPYPDSTIVERLTPVPVRLRLEEPPIASDPTTQGPVWPAMNGTAGSGEATAPVLFANYGLPEDYAVLDSLRVDVRGRIVIVRYGRSFRGIKAREAEKRGAAALLLYSDPQDDGYVRGDVYPDGPMRNGDAVQRGSVLNSDGDPSTPGWPSTDGARRLPEDSMDIPRIPVVPMGYWNAAIFLQELRGPSVPQSWQGGLPFRYHIGGGEVTAHVGLWHEQGDRAYKTITNTFGILRGSDWPDELVIAGAHRDAWGPGARDNISGVTSVLEAARAWGAAARAGKRPRRTLVFATWDAEEWGLVGSAEWVESMEDSLRSRAVAYLNQDDAAEGRTFGASGTASLYGFIRDLARAVAQPGESVTVYDAWRRRAKVADTADTPIGALGGGSDHGSFYNHLGIPSLGFGFGGPGGVYHSAYDTYTFQDRFGDPGFLSHVAAGRLVALALARLADADVVPLDYSSYGRFLQGLVGELRREVDKKGWRLPLDSLERAAGELMSAGRGFNEARDVALSAGSRRPAELAASNGLLRGIEQELTRATGLVGRPWHRNLVVDSDRDNGYADITLPGIAEALRDDDAARGAAEVDDLLHRIEAATTRLNAARTALPGR